MLNCPKCGGTMITDRIIDHGYIILQHCAVCGYENHPDIPRSKKSNNNPLKIKRQFKKDRRGRIIEINEYNENGNIIYHRNNITKEEYFYDYDYYKTDKKEK